MASYHRNDTAGPQVLPSGVSVTFRSLAADLAVLRTTGAALGIVDPPRTRVGQSEQGKDMHLIRIGKNPAMPVLITGCHHAREWISVEIPFLFAEFLITNYQVNPLVRRLVDARDIWIVPMVNPDGHERSVLVNRMWRKNAPIAAGRPAVDLNRNYATAFWSNTAGQTSSIPTSDSYGGPSAGFAAEVVAMQNLVRSIRFKGSLDFHSFGRFVLFPWAGQDAPPPDAFQEPMAERLERIIDAKGADYRRLQTSRLYHELDGLPTSRSFIPGDAQDFLVEQVPDAITTGIELEPAANDPRAFELPESEIEPAFALMRGAMLAFLNCLGVMRTPPPTAPLTLQPGVANNVAVFRQDCGSMFAAL